MMLVGFCSRIDFEIKKKAVLAWHLSNEKLPNSVVVFGVVVAVVKCCRRFCFSCGSHHRKISHI